MSENSDLSDHVLWLQSLCQRHPRLCGSALQESSRGYLFPPGWRGTVEDLLTRLEPTQSESQEVRQIKEKIGVLHISLQIRSIKSTALIAKARSVLATVCEDCGGSAPPNEFDAPLCSTCRTTQANP